MTTKTQLLEAKNGPLEPIHQLNSLRKIKRDSELELGRLEDSLVLPDDGRIKLVVELRAILSLIPKRIENAQRLLSEANRSLEQASKSFADEYLRPRLVAQVKSARETARREFQAILSDAAGLESRIGKSNLVVEVESMISELDQLTGATPIEYADNLLKLSEKSEEFETLERRLNDGSIWNRLLSPSIAARGK